MTDIIERLRNRRITNWVHGTGTPSRANGFALDHDCNEAADTIEALTAERDAARASKDRCVEILAGIYALMDPPLIQSGGKTYKFVNPHAAETLHELSNRIRAIPEALTGL